MEAGERQRLKTLANDAVIAEFGNNSLAAQLAVALEQAVDDLEYHGDCIGPRVEVDPEPAIVNLDTLQEIHRELKEQVREIDDAITAINDRVSDLEKLARDLKDSIRELGDEL